MFISNTSDVQMFSDDKGQSYKIIFRAFNKKMLNFVSLSWSSMKRKTVRDNKGVTSMHHSLHVCCDLSIQVFL